MLIQTETTPNPATLKFLPGQKVMEAGTRDFATPSGRKVTAGPAQPWTWYIAELFKIESGLIRRVEATLERVPYGMTSGWSSWEDGMSDRARDVTH